MEFNYEEFMKQCEICKKFDYDYDEVAVLENIYYRATFLYADNIKFYPL
jgi:hypothetical protein